MMLMEEGRFLLSEPVGKYLPELAAMSVATEGGGTVPAARPITIQDLLRHTSGLTYEFRGNGPVHQAYTAAKIARLRQTSADQVAMLGALPLLHQPGARWEYSRSTDVLGRLIEVVSGQSLGAFLSERICGPLGMVDTAFHVPARDHGRLAGGFAKDPDSGADVVLLDVREKPSFESGGGGMVSTSADYARFMQAMLDGGALGTTRLLGRKSVELMTADHLGPIEGSPDLLPPGHGFGLGFAVRRDRGIAPTPGSVGMYFWHGMAGTTFWIDPAEDLAVVFMMQAPGQRDPYRGLLRDMVYSAIVD
jgi:CubicO group peptidase (beta-lactamase class C family)